METGEARKRPLGYGLVFVLVGLLVGAGVVLGLLNKGVLHSAKITSDTIEASFDDIAELATEEYNYRDVAKREVEGWELRGFTVPFTGKHFLVTYDGTVKAGVQDFSAIKVNTDEVAGTVTVRIPAAKVLSSHIDQDSMEVYDQSMNPFNQLKIQDFKEFIVAEEKDAEKQAVEKGLLERADKRAEELIVAQIKAVLEGTDKESYEVKVTR